MVLSDLSIRRPVVTVVLALVVVLIGALAFQRLPVREYPNIDPPVVSVETFYRGAAAEVVESRITRPLEDQLAAIEGLRILRSVSSEQRSRITLEFNVGVDVDRAANDVRDRVARARSALPQDVREPLVAKQDADANPFIRIVFASDTLSLLEVTDWVDRFVRTRLQTVPGVGNIELRGNVYAMRLWLDPDRLAAFGLTPGDVERALREQNVDIPGGRIESLSREFPIRVEGDLAEAAEFENLVLATRGTYQVTLRDVGRAELGSDDYRIKGYFKGQLSASIGVVRQSQSNLLEVAAAVKAELERIRPLAPEGLQIEIAFDESVFVERSVAEVYRTIIEAVLLVVAIIFLFLRDWRSTFVPLLAIPISIVGTFAVMAALGFTINILTLLALVLAVGLVVDDAIVVLENIYRRIETGEPPIRASVFGSRQVAFAVIATTLVLAGVFLPVAFQSGQTGRLFYEFAITLAIAVAISSFVALSLTPMVCSRLLRPHAPGKEGRLHRWTEPAFLALNRVYARTVAVALRRPWIPLVAAAGFVAGGLALYPQLPRELVPTEDRGLFRGFFNGPQGATPDYVRLYTSDMAAIVASTPEIEKYFFISGIGTGNQAFFVGFLQPWEERTRKTQQVVQEINRRLSTEITGGLARATPIRPIGQRGLGSGDAFIVVLRGPDFERLQSLASDLSQRMRESGLFLQPRVEPSPTKPQLDVRIDRARAADLGVPVSEIASTLETLFGGRRATEFKKNAQSYDVILQLEDGDRATPSDLGRIYVRSASGDLVLLSNVVELVERTVPESYPHLDRIRSVNLSSTMVAGRTIGDGVDFMNGVRDDLLPEGYDLVFDGETREFLESGRDTLFIFILALLFTFLILAAQFESWTHPVTIFTGVFVAVAAGIGIIWASRFWVPADGALTNNLFSQFGLIMLIGLVAKNGILIVEFANQLQVEGRPLREAVQEAATLRFRPILMTAISTVVGVLPLAFASGAGAETRNALGTVVAGGLALSTFISLYVVPSAYLAMDHLVRRLTGRSSAAGLIRAREIGEEVEEAERSEPALTR